MGNNFLSRTDEELAEIYQRNVDMIYRLCYIYLKNPDDTKDAVQSVFLKLIEYNIAFTDHEHEKAWCIVTTKNHCKDILKSWWKSHQVDLEHLPEITFWDKTEQNSEVLEKLLLLPQKYKIVLYLYYYENYSVKEIATLLKLKESTVQTQLARGRERLKIDIGGNYNG